MFTTGFITIIGINLIHKPITSIKRRNNIGEVLDLVFGNNTVKKVRSRQNSTRKNETA